MKRALLIVLLLLVPATLTAEIATMGIFFDLIPASMADYPTPFSFFDVYLYMHHADYYVTAVEYQLQTPSDLTHALYQINSVGYPEYYSVSLGDPFNGHSISYWPPLDGYNPGYNLLCKITGFTTDYCWNEDGPIVEYYLVVGPHPDTGECKGTYWPDNLTFPIVGRTSIICPQDPVAVQEESWGAIKAMSGE
jgi:hypothetical protein